MFPSLELFHNQFSTYNLVFVFSFFVASAGIVFSLCRDGIKMGDAFLLCASFFIGMVVGGKILYIILNFKMVSEKISEPVFLISLLTSGRTFIGGLMGGILSAYLYCRWMRLFFIRLLDQCTVWSALGYSIGRVGCFLHGCCRGTETQSILGVPFPDEMSPVICRHPVQLYDSLLNMYLFLFLLEFSQKKKYDGQVFLMFLLLNSSIRFLMEYFRWGVSAQVMFGVITQAQVVCVAIIIFSLCVMRKFNAGRQFMSQKT